MSTQPIPVSEFASAVRAKYPGAYDHLSDSELVNGVVTKYPQYKSQIANYAPTEFEKERTPTSSSVARLGAGIKESLPEASLLHAIPGEPLVEQALGLKRIPEEIRAGAASAREVTPEIAGHPTLTKIAKGISSATGGAAGALAPLVGISPTAMREKAEHGDTAGILGQATIPTATALTPIAHEGIRAGRSAVSEAIRVPETGELRPAARTAAQLGGAAAGGAYGAMHGSPYAAVAGAGAGYRLGPGLIERAFPETAGRQLERIGAKMEREFGPRTEPAPYRELGAPFPRTEDFYAHEGAERNAIRARTEAAERSANRGEGRLQPVGGPTVEPQQVKPLAERAMGQQKTAPKPTEIAARIARILGNETEPISPQRGIPLREQLRPIEQSTEVKPIEEDALKAKYPDKNIRQFVRAHGEQLYEAAKGDPDLMKQLHDLTRVDLRQALINSGEDMGQRTVSNSKFAGEGSIPREAAFNKLLERHSPQEIMDLAKTPNSPGVTFSFDKNGVKWAETPGLPKVSIPKGIEPGQLADYLKEKFELQREGMRELSTK